MISPDQRQAADRRNRVESGIARSDVADVVLGHHRGAEHTTDLLLTCTCMCIRMLPMRTTIELTDEQRSELLRLAAKRHLKGFSQIVQEAVNEYLLHQGGKAEAIDAALSLEGCLDSKAADRFEERVLSLRESWRCS
jgi:hypothetical protein